MSANKVGEGIRRCEAELTSRRERWRSEGTGVAQQHVGKFKLHALQVDQEWEMKGGFLAVVCIY